MKLFWNMAKWQKLLVVKIIFSLICAAPYNYSAPQSKCVKINEIYAWKLQNNVIYEILLKEKNKILQVKVSPDQLLVFILNSLKDSFDIKEEGRLFQRRLLRKAKEFNPNVWVLVAGRHNLEPTRRAQFWGFILNKSHKKLGDSLFIILYISLSKNLRFWTCIGTCLLYTSDAADE